MSDYYRDRCRHGGILSNTFISFWWNRQVITNQYGRPGRSSSNWGIDTIEGYLEDSELVQNRQDQTIDNVENRFRNDEYYASKEYDLDDIKVLLLKPELKYLRFITGRYDLPFYYDEEAKLQRSFPDAFLKDEDRVGWSQHGKLPPVNLCPIARTECTKFYLHPDQTLSTQRPSETEGQTLSYEAHGSVAEARGKPKPKASFGGYERPSDTLGTRPTQLQFTSAPFEEETEFTGHVTAYLNISAIQAKSAESVPSEIDIFLTLRHVGLDGREILYTGTAGDPVPLTKDWLRASLRHVNTEDPRHRDWLPH
ncbi:hypothetical protein LTR09_012834 [Extremus antarcticus]|uniref:Xaa-Pro dipeptidyl-peptidase C-terminal domain-containing protein n=1 Tax=Extremus antarcticus TaxID=702011 RepID=A0AAJ0D4L8_9PEZI|nr:hypothetical protein LTR09_012834 [Extremus antarcticus]